MNSMNGVVALLCCENATKIQEASKAAFGLWGSKAIRGAVLASLMADESMSSWMENEMSSSSSFGGSCQLNGFCIRELGFIEFRNKHLTTFDACVLVARLPAEAGIRPMASLVIIEPIKVAQEQMMIKQPAAPNWARPVNRRGPSSVVSSVHSEDITADDSVSNVNVNW